MSGHFYLPFLLLFSTFLITGGALSRRYPRLRRPVGVVAGLLIVALGLTLPLLFPGGTTFALFRWAVIASGAMLGLGAALNWLPVTEDDAPMRPTAARSRRHFGETS